jgi:hypothetical protein
VRDLATSWGNSESSRSKSFEQVGSLGRGKPSSVSTER